MRTIWVRRFSSWFNRSSIFVDFIGIMKQQTYPTERAKRHSAAPGVLSVWKMTLNQRIIGDPLAWRAAKAAD
jgi:hypothetical protein